MYEVAFVTGYNRFLQTVVTAIVLPLGYVVFVGAPELFFWIIAFLLTGMILLGQTSLGNVSSGGGREG